MPNLSQEITIKIIDEITKAVPYFEVDIQQQIRLRNKIDELLNDFEITSRCTDLVKGDLLEKAYIFLSCKRLEGMAESTSYNYRLMFKIMAEYFNKPLSMVTTIDLRMFLAKAYASNQPNSINSKIWKIKAFFQWLQDEGYIVQNPARNLHPTKEPERRRGHVKQIDVEKMREQCKSIRDKALFEFLLSTGCRVSEASDAEIDKIDWSNNNIKVVGKGNKERTVIFSTRARLFLINYIEGRERQDIHSNSLFVAGKYPYYKLGRRSIEKDIGKIAERAGITYNIFPHLLRHTFATTAVNQDVALPALQRLMGHESSDTTQIYYDYSEESINKEYRKMAL
jgi:integrase/recombinase XerD